MASPTRVVDGTSGMVYVSSDGADDTAIGNTAEVVDTYTVVFRSPTSTFNNYAGILENPGGGNGDSLGFFRGSDTRFHHDAGQDDRPRAVRRNGVLLATAFDDLSPINAWMILSVAVKSPTQSRTLGLFQLVNALFLSANLACLRKWPAAPTAAVVAATEQELASYYGPLIANGSN